MKHFQSTFLFILIPTRPCTVQSQVTKGISPFTLIIKMIGMIPMASKTSFKTKPPNLLKSHMFVWHCPVNLLYFIPCKRPLFHTLKSWHSVVWTGLSHSIMGSSCWLGTAVQEVSLGSYIDLSCAKAPCRRARYPLRLLAMRSFF